MSLATLDCFPAAADAAQLDVLAEFELDVQVTTELAAGQANRACDTSDGCGSTCYSACVSS